MKKYLVTSALPYANGPIHPGHLVGAYLPADIYTRHLRMNGEKVIHISGSDEYGVAIMLNAQKAGQDFGEYVDHWHKEHKRIFEKFEVGFDFFGQTHLPYHKEEVLLWFKALHEKGLIEPED
ncbi:MAG: class I tRNA ligase family protein, partial [Bacteriovoracales bacterium]